MLHGLCVGEEAGARNRVFFSVKWLQPAMKGIPRLCGDCGCGRFCRELFLLCVLQRVVVPVCVVLCVSWSCGGRSHWNCCMMLQGLCVGEEAGARNLVFFRVKWLQPAMKGTLSVRRLRLRSFLSRIVPPMCFAASGCSCVRSSMRFLKRWLQIALEWLHDVAWALCWGGSRSTKPCVFPSGDERYLVCAAVAAAVVSVANCSSYVFCNEWLFLCA